jgi:hypothetical protein
MVEMLKALLGHFVVSAVLLGAMLLLFTNLRFDHAAYAFLALIAAALAFVYWPRSTRKGPRQP